MWLLLGLGVLVLLEVVTSFAPGLNTWGVDHWSDISPVWRALFVVLIAACCVPHLAASVDSAATELLSPKVNRLIAVGVLALLTFVLRIDAMAYGDGYSFPGYFEGGGMPSINAHLATQYFDLLVHWVVYRFVVMPMGGSVPTAYALIASIAVVFAVWALIRIAAALSRDTAVRRLIVASAMASGAMVLFFGHVESYTLVNVALLWTLAFSLEARTRRKLVWAAWGCWIAAVAFHQLAVVTIPAMIWATIRTFRPAERPLNRETVIVAFGLGFLAWMAATALYRTIALPVFTPVLSTADSSYTAFSPRHIVDQFNLLLFLAPVSVVALVGWVINVGRQKPSTKLGIVAVFAASAWMFSFWLDPLIGTFRDWDLLSPFGIPLSIWAGFTIAHWFTSIKPPSWLWVPVAAVAVGHVGGFVVSAQDEMTVIARVDRLVQQDPHYSPDYFEGSRLPPWATALAKGIDRPDLAKPHLIKAALAKPSDATRWANLGNAYENLGQYDSARIAYVTAVAIDTANERYLRNLGILQQRTRDWEGAIETSRRLIALYDTAYQEICTLGLMYAQVGRYDDALLTMDEAKSINPESPLAWYYAGQVYEVMADTANALEQFEAALERGDTRNEDLHQRRVQLLQWSGRVDEAIAAAREWERYLPQSELAPFLMGTAYSTEERYDSAKAALDRARNLAPQSPTILFYLGSVERNLGLLDSAETHLLQSAAMDPNMAYPFLELVYLYDDQGDLEAARQAAARYLQVAPQDSSMGYLQKFIK
ncbi:MAG: hypothetical protein Kow0074_08170 [Candidatus Zixiibacteriota bacterium]